jgi:predicted PurR-regulated permease PerM
MPPGLAIGIVYVGIFVTIGVTAYTLSPLLNDQINEFKTQKSNYLTSAKARAQKLNDLYQRARIPPQVRKTISEYLDRKINSIGDYTEVVIQAVLRVLGFIPWMFLVPILAFFFLKDVDSFRRSALSLLPSGRLRWRGDEFFQDINTTLAAFTRAQLTACLLIGIICSIGFSLIGVPYALLFGVLAGFFEFVPLVGPLVLAILVAAISSFHSSTEVFVVLVFLGGLRIVHDYFVYPRIIGQGIHLHPLAIILAILSGAELGGIVGIFLAVPVVAVATVSYKHWQEHRGEGLVVHLLTDEETGSSDLPIHPSASTTPEEMARARPDLLSGELKRPSRS